MQKIEINPNKLCGKPIIVGTRIPVYLILNLLNTGYGFDRIIKAYPELTKKDIKTAIKYKKTYVKKQNQRNLNSRR